MNKLDECYRRKYQQMSVMSTLCTSRILATKSADNFQGFRVTDLVLSYVLYMPTSLSASSNMLFLKEMMMNCAFFVRS